MTSPSFFKHSKHVFILSWSGRPIYSRYGDETKLAGFMGVISTMIAILKDQGDQVRCMRSGPWNFVFRVRGPLYLVAVSRTGESTNQLVNQLDHLHAQVISVLTGGINAILTKRPQYDLRNLLGGTTMLLNSLIYECDHNPSYLLNSINCLRMPFNTRDEIGRILRADRPANCMFGVLVAGSHIVDFAARKKCPISTKDLMLVVHFVTHFQSLRDGESWTPICLPEFNDKGFFVRTRVFFGVGRLFGAHQQRCQ